MKNKLIVIGITSGKQCYLNITKEEAILRFCKSEGVNPEDINSSPGYANYDYEEFEFEDEFCAYEVWAKINEQDAIIPEDDCE